jgi:hypothetical protein
MNEIFDQFSPSFYRAELFKCLFVFWVIGELGVLLLRFTDLYLTLSFLSLPYNCKLLFRVYFFNIFTSYSGNASIKTTIPPKSSTLVTQLLFLFENKLSLPENPPCKYILVI